MGLIVKEPEGSNIPPIEEGTYIAVCKSIIDLGDQWSEKFKKASPKVLFVWAIPDETIDINGETVPRTVSGTYSASLAEKSNLRKMLEGWRGRKFSPDELKGFDLRNVLNVPCFVNIVHKPSADGSRTYTEVAAVMRLHKGVTPPECDMPATIYSIEEDFTFEKMTDLPEWIQGRIKSSEQFKAFESGEVPAAEAADFGTFEDVFADDNATPWA